MSNIHYFQRYSQKENVATNNTLLLFSRLYNSSPTKFKYFLNEILENKELNIGINFQQQEKGRKSTPDGKITQESFKIIIETKLNAQSFNIKQLKEHLKNFGNESHQILFTLSPNGISNKSNKSDIHNLIKDYNSEKGYKIEHIDITFKRIIEVFNTVIHDYDFELKDIIDDFEDYCNSSKLMTFSEYRMRAVVCGDSLEVNLNHDLYFAPSERNFSEHSYIGLYNNKTIKAVGKIENIITANFDGRELEIKHKISEITDNQIKKIIGVIQDAKHNIGWDISRNHTFFCVEKFVSTNFIKNSKYGLQKSKFFDLKEYGIGENSSIEDIANHLKNKEWE